MIWPLQAIAIACVSFDDTPISNRSVLTRSLQIAVRAWVKSKFGASQPAGPETLLRHFTPDIDSPITQDGVAEIDGGWRIETQAERTIRLFEAPDPGIEQCVVSYRAEMRSEGVEKRAYLEMWCRLPGQGEFFSKGFHNALAGDNDWGSYEIPFYLKAGQRPDLLIFNLVFDGPGIIEIRDIHVTVTPVT